MVGLGESVLDHSTAGDGAGVARPGGAGIAGRTGPSITEGTVGGAYIDLCPRGGASVAEQPLQVDSPATGAVNVQQLIQVQLCLVALPDTEVTERSQSGHFRGHREVTSAVTERSQQKVTAGSRYIRGGRQSIGANGRWSNDSGTVMKS